MVKNGYYNDKVFIKSLRWYWSVPRSLSKIAFSKTAFKRGAFSETAFKPKSSSPKYSFLVKKVVGKRYYRNSGLGLAGDRIKVL